MKDGILIVDKEKNMTSRDVVNIACKKLNTRHIGHTGTLDPIATGVIVLGVNNGCKIIDLLTSSDKIYEAEIIIGLETDTLDITGKKIKSYDIEEIDFNNIENIVKSFKGKYMQEVPKYSAIHVDGKRLYEYARNDIDVVLPKREVEIFDIEIIGKLEKLEYYTFSIRVHVSKGTYIRSLIRDIGIKLGYPCTMKNLRRIKQGIFEINDAIKLDNIDSNKLISIADSLKNYDKIIVDDITSKKVLNGSILDMKIKNNYVLIFNNQNKLLAIYEIYKKNPNKIKPYRVFGE